MLLCSHRRLPSRNLPRRATAAAVATLSLGIVPACADGASEPQARAYAEAVNATAQTLAGRRWRLTEFCDCRVRGGQGCTAAMLAVDSTLREVQVDSFAVVRSLGDSVVLQVVRGTQRSVEFFRDGSTPRERVESLPESTRDPASVVVIGPDSLRTGYFAYGRLPGAALAFLGAPAPIAGPTLGCAPRPDRPALLEAR